MQIQEERAVSVFFVPLFQFFVGVFLFIALLYGFRELILFTSILLGIGIGANIWSRLSPLHISCDLGMDRLRVFPDETLKLRIQIINAKCLPVMVGIAIRFSSPSIHVDHEEEGFEAACGLLWYQRCRFQKELTFTRRGVYRLGPPGIMVGDLFGFYKREKQVESSIEVIVYPRIRGVRPVSLPKRDFYGTPGARGLVEDPVYIYGTRDYQPGRPVRRIHWKASARYNRMQEKLCEPAEREKAMLLLEVGRFAEARAEEAFERTIEEAASYAAWLDRKGRALGFAANSVLTGGRSPVIPVARGPGQLALILEALARVTIRPEGGLLEILSRVYPLPWGVTCLIFSCEPCEATTRIEASLRHRKIPAVVLHASTTPSLFEVRGPSPANGWARDDACPRGGLNP
jgi:uncharacterized protein (DUF58 family)